MTRTYGLEHSKRLAIFVYSSLTTPSLIACAEACTSSNLCVSFNFCESGQLVANSTKNCELNTGTKYYAEEEQFVLDELCVFGQVVLWKLTVKCNYRQMKVQHICKLTKRWTYSTPWVSLLWLSEFLKQFNSRLLPFISLSIYTGFLGLSFHAYGENLSSASPSGIFGKVHDQRILHRPSFAGKTVRLGKGDLKPWTTWRISSSQ